MAEIKVNNEELEREIKKMIAKLEAAHEDIVEECVGIVDVVTDKLLEESVKRAPIDEGMLEKSHEKTVEKTFILKDIVGRVFIPANSPASDYALYMHEGDYNLGEHSQRKNAVQDEEVGPKFLERALNENEKAFRTYISKKLKEMLT